MLYMEHNNYNISLEILGCLMKKERHIRELSRVLEKNHMTVKRAAEDLVKNKILDFEYFGKNKVFSLKKNIESRSKILEYEIYKQTKIISEYPILRKIFDEIIKNKKIGLALLFGSYAKNTAHNKSDIDLYVETENLGLKKELENLNSKISVKIGKFNRDSLLIKEMMDNHVIIKGFEKYYEKTND